MAVKIFNRNKSKDGKTVNSVSSVNYSIGGNIGGGGTSGLNSVTLTGDVIDERATFNGTQLILDTHINDGVVTWDNCSTDLKSRINAGGGGGGSVQEIEYIESGATSQTVQTALNNGYLPVLINNDQYFYYDNENDGVYYFYSPDNFVIGVGSNGWSSPEYAGGIKIVSTTSTGTSILTLRAGNNVTITSNDLTGRDFTIAATGGGGGTTEIEYIDNTSSTQDIDIILAGGKLPVFKDNDGKLYYYDTTEEINQHTQHYFISGSGDMWWIDTNDEWWYDNSINARSYSLNDSASYSNFNDGNLRLIGGNGINIANGSSGNYNGIVISATGSGQQIFEATLSTTYDAVEAAAADKLVILKNGQKAYILSHVDGSVTRQRTYYFYTTQGEGYKLYYENDSTSWEPLLGIPIRKWILNDTPASDPDTHADNYTYSTTGGIRLIAGTGISIAEGYTPNNRGGIIISNTSQADVIDDFGAAGAGVGKTLVGYGTTLKHINKAAACGNASTPIYIDTDGVATACTGIATTNDLGNYLTTNDWNTYLDDTQILKPQWTENGQERSCLPAAWVNTPESFNDFDLDDRKVDSTQSALLATYNLPADFITGLISGKYRGIEFGQDYTYDGVHDVLEGVYMVTGIVQTVESWTEGGQDYSRSPLIIAMHNQWYSFTKDGYSNIEVQIWYYSGTGYFNILVKNDET